MARSRAVARASRELGDRATLVLTCLLACLLAVAGCTGGEEPDPEDAIPPTRSGEETPVEVCLLVPVDDVSGVVERQLSLVDGRYLSAALPTYRCGFGTSFAAPVVTVSLAPGPVAVTVFDQAYGEPAGGDPSLVERLGDRAYLRSEAGTRTLSVLTGGAIVQVSSEIDLSERIRPPVLIELARLAVDRLPGNPVLGAPESGLPCSEVPHSAVAAPLGVPPKLASQVARPDGSAVCSWAGLPGSVTVTVGASHHTFEATRRQLRRGGAVEVPGLDDGRAWSAADRPGDLVVLAAPATVVHVDVVPAAGWASDDVPTTAAELDLAQTVVDRLT